MPGGFASWAALLATQRRLVTAAEAISATIRPTDGLAGISAMPEHRALWIYWKGALPARVSRAVDAQRERVPIRVLPAAYSQRQMIAGAITWPVDATHIGYCSVSFAVLRAGHTEMLSAGHCGVRDDQQLARLLRGDDRQIAGR